MLLEIVLFQALLQCTGPSLACGVLDIKHDHHRQGTAVLLLCTRWARICQVTGAAIWLQDLIPETQDLLLQIWTWLEQACTVICCSKCRCCTQCSGGMMEEAASLCCKPQTVQRSRNPFAVLQFLNRERCCCMFSTHRRAVPRNSVDACSDGTFEVISVIESSRLAQSCWCPYHASQLCQAHSS